MCHQVTTSHISTPSKVARNITNILFAQHHNLFHQMRHPTHPASYDPSLEVGRITYDSAALGAYLGGLMRELRGDEEENAEIELESEEEEGSGYEGESESGLEDEGEEEEEYETAVLTMGVDVNRSGYALIRQIEEEREIEERAEVYERAMEMIRMELYQSSASYAWSRYRAAVYHENDWAAGRWWRELGARVERERVHAAAVHVAEADLVQALGAMLQLPVEVRGAIYRASQAGPSTTETHQAGNDNSRRLDLPGLVRGARRYRQRRDSGPLLVDLGLPPPQDEPTFPAEEPEVERTYEDISPSAEWTQAEINMAFDAICRPDPKAKDQEKEEISRSSKWTQAEINMAFQALSRYPQHSNHDAESGTDADTSAEADDDDSEDQTSQPDSLDDWNIQVWQEDEETGEETTQPTSPEEGNWVVV